MGCVFEKISKRSISLRKQRLHVWLESSFASLLIVDILDNLNSKTKPTKDYLNQAWIKKVVFEDDLLLTLCI